MMDAQSRSRLKKRLIKLIRQNFKPLTEPQACAVCGKFRLIAEMHHLIPVHELAEFCIKHGISYVNLPVRYAWLCPTHHAVYHYFYTGLYKKPRSLSLQAELANELSPDEWHNIHKLMGDAQWEKLFALIKDIDNGGLYE